jgi:large subunit ribosomal protein L3
MVGAKMPGILGKKLGMSNIFSPEGNRIPVTVIEAGPCKVLSIKTQEKHGYNALQLGYGVKKKANKPTQGAFAKINVAPPQHIKEFRVDNTAEFEVGGDVTVALFTEGEKVKLRGKTKGKGFQGVMRRHGFGGVGGTTHGQSDRLRAPGSVGSSSYPSRVFKGQRMAGRMGHTTVTVRNLKIVKIIPEKNILLVAGAVPGAINSILEILKAN